MVAWAGDYELDPSSREGLSGPNTNQICAERSMRRRQTLRVVVSVLQWRPRENHANLGAFVWLYYYLEPDHFSSIR